MIDLTKSQQEVIDIHYSENQLVIAGPGTGKTTTGIAMIKSFDSQLDSQQARSVLFLSFSRAAIQAAFESVEDEIKDLDLFVDHQTIDALATAQLVEFSYLDEASLDFDSRIKRATTLLKEHGEELLEDVCHIIVDESQDILGIRQDYLIELIAHLPEDCGISVFGDPFQSIYRFLALNKEKSQRDNLQNTSLVEWEIFVDRAFKHRTYTSKILRDQFRANSSQAKWLYSELESMRTSKKPNEVLNQLRSVVSDLTPVSVQGLKKYLPRWAGSTSLLTRTNADAVQLFELLRTHKIPVEIVLKNELKPNLPCWLAKWALVSDEDSFNTNDLYQYLSDNKEYLKQAYDLGIDFSVASELSWNQIRQDSQFYRPRSRIQVPANSIAISTVHQAKGLEFDYVLVHNPNQYTFQQDSSASEFEALFVALSRGKKQINAFNAPLEKVVSRERTLLRPHPNPKYRPKSICITPGDIDYRQVVGDASSQRRLANFSAGDMLDFEVISSSFEVPIYRCYLDKMPVAITTEEFGRKLIKTTRTRLGAWPKLAQVPIAYLQSSFSKDVSRKAPFLSPMPLGFSKISYK